MVNDECINRFETIRIAGLVATRSKPFKCFTSFCSVCLVSGTYLLQHTLNNRPAVMESNFKCSVDVYQLVGLCIYSIL